MTKNHEQNINTIDSALDFYKFKDNFESLGEYVKQQLKPGLSHQMSVIKGDIFRKYNDTSYKTKEDRENIVKSEISSNLQRLITFQLYAKLHGHDELQFSNTWTKELEDIYIRLINTIKGPSNLHYGDGYSTFQTKTIKKA